MNNFASKWSGGPTFFHLAAMPTPKHFISTLRAHENIFRKWQVEILW
jgi:hypothetical protein